jgi:hypothetical protein
MQALLQALAVWFGSTMLEVPQNMHPLLVHE